MTHSLHLLAAPVAASLTGRLIEHGRRFPAGSVLWIAPDDLALDALRRRWLAERAGILPRLHTFATLGDAIVRWGDPTAKPITDVSRQLLLDALVAQQSERKELSHFDAVIHTRGFAAGLEAWLAELKGAEIWPTHLARAAYLRGYRGDDTGRRIAGRSIRRKERELVRFYARYQQRLRQQGEYDREGMLWHARDLLARGGRAPFETIRGVLVDGFAHFNRTQLEMLHAFAGWVEEVWVTLPDEPGDDRAELFARGRQTRSRLAANFAITAEPVELGVASRPAGLRHLDGQLFRPARAIERSADASGLLLLAAPGRLGEARLAAREIKQLLLEGVAASDIVVTLRDPDPYADLLDEVFTEYGIPLSSDEVEPLARNPAVALLLRARRLPEEGWPFAGLAALLRSTFLRPAWPEASADRAGQTEALLRLLGEPAGRDAYLAAIQRWIDEPPPLMEDEEDFPRRRQLTHQLAQRCQPFLNRLFQAWDAAPTTAPAAEHVAWLRRLAADLGLPRSASARDLQALKLLFAELDRLSETLDAAGFARQLTAISQTAGLPRSASTPGCVRVLPAHRAVHLDVAQLLVMGLSEGAFPDLSAPSVMFDEAERHAFQRAGLDFPPLADRMSEEMLLFHRLVSRAGDRLVLSYPAVDEQGQDLLPSSFLAGLLDCFTPDTVPTIRRRLLIEGHIQEPARSPAELRVQAAAQGQLQHLDAELAGNLAAAAELADARFRRPDFTTYDGLLQDGGIVTELNRSFGPERIFSPTALEDYAACPFRFFLRQALRLEPLEEPGQELVPIARGLLIHRALARLHRRLSEDGIHRPEADLVDQLQGRLADAVHEHSHAASPATRELWRLEGLRLQRWLRRYPGHWSKFLAPWQAQGVALQPQHFEAAFGGHGVAPLVIGVGEITVRIGGRIDRIDLAEIEEEIGFWIIDYKTGGAQYYRKGGDLDHLQLPLYALAVEEVILSQSSPRPLGLAYWMVTGTGCKLSLPAKATDWLADAEPWQRYRDQLKSWVQTLAGRIRQGEFPLKPRYEAVCAACAFGQVCRISQCRDVVENKSWQLALPIIE